MYQQTIVKVQLPLGTNEDIPHMLVYNEDRSVEVYTPVQERFAQELREAHKGFYHATVNDDQVNIGSPAAWQSW